MAAMAAPPPTATDLEEMSLEDVKKKMFAKLQQGGKLGALKAGVRQMMFADMAAGRTNTQPQLPATAQGTRKPLAQLAVDTVVLEYLKTCGYHFSYSVFVSESNLQAASVNKITLDDAHGLLGNVDTTHDCIRPLVTALARSRRSGCVDAEVQAGEQDVMRLDYKLSMIDEDFKQLRSKSSTPSIERRMKAFEEELTAESKKTIAAEVERFRQSELSQMRLQEAAKYEKQLSQKLQDFAEQERQLKHEMLMEKYDIQSRQREVEHMTRQFEKERADHVLQAQSRDSAFAAVQKELLDKEAFVQELEVKLRGVTSDLRTSRQLCSDFQSKQQQYSQELLRVQREQQADTERRAAEWAEYQREKNNILAEYQHKILENDLTLQNKMEELRREHDDKERARKAQHAEELQRVRDMLEGERATMKANIERDVRAQLAEQIKQLQDRQKEFCQAMVSTQMEIELQRNTLRKEAAEVADYMQLGRRAAPVSLSVYPSGAKRGGESTRRRRAEEHAMDLTLLSQQLMSEGASEQESEESVSPGHDDLLQAIREQAKRNYALLGEESIDHSPQQHLQQQPAAAAHDTAARPAHPLRHVSTEQMDRHAQAAFEAYGYGRHGGDGLGVQPQGTGLPRAQVGKERQQEPQQQQQHVAAPVRTDVDIPHGSNAYTGHLQPQHDQRVHAAAAAAGRRGAGYSAPAPDTLPSLPAPPVSSAPSGHGFDAALADSCVHKHLPPPSPAHSTRSGLPPVASGPASTAGSASRDARPAAAAAAAAVREASASGSGTHYSEPSSSPTSRESSAPAPAAATPEPPPEAEKPPTPPRPPSPPTAAEASGRGAVVGEELAGRHALERSGVETAETVERTLVADEGERTGVAMATKERLMATEYAETAARDVVVKEEGVEKGGIDTQYKEAADKLNPQQMALYKAMADARARREAEEAKKRENEIEEPEDVSFDSYKSDSTSGSSENPWGF